MECLMDHVEDGEGNLYVKVSWSGYDQQTWEPAKRVDHELL